MFPIMIELMGTGNGLYVINANNIITYFQHGENTDIYMNGSEEIYITKETPTEIRTLIDKEVERVAELWYKYHPLRLREFKFSTETDYADLIIGPRQIVDGPIDQKESNDV